MGTIVAASIAVGGIRLGIDENIVAIHCPLTGDTTAVGAYAVFAMVATVTAVRDIGHDIGGDAVAIARAITCHTVTIDTSFAIGTAVITIATVIDRCSSIIGYPIAQFITKAFAIAASQTTFAFIVASTAIVDIIRRLDAGAAAFGPSVYHLASNTLPILQQIPVFTVCNGTLTVIAEHIADVSRHILRAVCIAIAAVICVFLYIHTFKSTSGLW